MRYFSLRPLIAAVAAAVFYSCSFSLKTAPRGFDILPNMWRHGM